VKREARQTESHSCSDIELFPKSKFTSKRPDIYDDDNIVELSG
jgi:hypothetical protein